MPPLDVIADMDCEVVIGIPPCPVPLDNLAPAMTSEPPAVTNGRRPPERPVLLHGVQQLPAGLLAAPTGLLADPAVLVHRGMPPALVAAALADGHAGFQQRPGHAGVALRRAAHDRDGGGANI